METKKTRASYSRLKKLKIAPAKGVSICTIKGAFTKKILIM
jgi:hypothetical protein